MDQPDVGFSVRDELGEDRCIEGLSLELTDIVSRLRAVENKLKKRTRTSLDRARNIYRARRLRDSLFPSGIFGEPAWDMVLDLYQRQLCGLKTSVSSLCIASACPQTTALNYIQRLEKQGVLIRSVGERDKRTKFIHLSVDSFNYIQRVIDDGAPNL